MRSTKGQVVTNDPKNKELAPPNQNATPKKPSRVGRPFAASYPEGQQSRSPNLSASSGLSGGGVRESPTANGNHQPNRPGPGVPLDPKDLLEAFWSGQPQVVFEAIQKFVQGYQALDKEAAQLRFKVNFGSEKCSKCDGLRAGPHVVATCYQVRECRYTNIKEPGYVETNPLAHLMSDD